MLEELHDSIFLARLTKPKDSMYQSVSGAALPSARYQERVLKKIKDLGRVRMGGVRNQSQRVKARSKKERNNE